MLISRGGPTPTLELAEGRHLGPEDVGRPVVVVGPAQPWLHVDDELTFRIGGRQATLEVVGVTLDSPLEEEFFTEGGNFVAPLGALDPAIQPRYCRISADRPRVRRPGHRRPDQPDRPRSHRH